MRIRTHSFCCAALLTVAASGAHAELLTVNFTARVASVYDEGNALANAVWPGEMASGSYTYDAAAPDFDSSPAYGIYDQPQGRARLAIGSIVFESDSSFQGGPFNVTVQPSGSPGSAPGAFRISSFSNKPLANGASVSRLEASFENPFGWMPASDSLPGGAPDPWKFPMTWISVEGEMNGRPYSVWLQIESAQPPESELIVSPGKSTFLREQIMDAVLLLPAGSDIVSMQGSIAGTQIFGYPGSCQLGPPNTQNRPTLRCWDALCYLPAGTQHIEWQVELASGEVLTSTVDWEIIP